MSDKKEEEQRESRPRTTQHDTQYLIASSLVLRGDPRQGVLVAGGNAVTC